MWILILTLWTGHGVSISPIYGFYSDKECAVAGDAWLKKMDSPNSTALCVHKSNKKDVKDSE